MPREVSISTAARLLGTEEEVIRDWIRRGLLKSYERTEFDSAGLPPGTLGCTSLRTIEMVECSELYEVAEEEGWLMLSAETWDDETGK